jgi:dynein heavy chain
VCVSQHDVEVQAELTTIRTELITRLEDAVGKAMQYRSSFDNYAYLWVDDRAEFLHQFLHYSHMLTQVEKDQLAEGSLAETPPTLDQFKDKVL